MPNVNVAQKQKPKLQPYEKRNTAMFCHLSFYAKLAIFSASFAFINIMTRMSCKHMFIKWNHVDEKQAAKHKPIVLPYDQ